MAYQLVTANTDLTALGKGRKLASWHFKNTGVAGTINLRNASASGDIVVPIALPVGSTTPVSASQAYAHPYLHFPAGLYVEVVAGTIVGSVDII